MVLKDHYTLDDFRALPRSKSVKNVFLRFSADIVDGVPETQTAFARLTKAQAIEAAKDLLRDRPRAQLAARYHTNEQLVIFGVGS